MTVKVPFRSLKVGAYQVAVKRLSKKDGENNWGLYWPGKYQMDLHTAYPNKQKAAETFLHECMHIVFEERGVELGKMEEKVVTEGAKGLFALLRDNPEAMKWLVKCAS